MDSRQCEDILRAYRMFHGHLISMNPIFQQSTQNDSQEVLTFLINAFHKEAGQHIPEHIAETLDPVSKTIIRDFNQSVSNILETTVICTQRTSSDNTQIIETFTTLFVEPAKQEDGIYSLQAALDKIQFASVPKVLFMSLIMGSNANCKLVFDITLANQQYRLSSIVFYIPGANHYITAVRRRRQTEQEEQGWYVMNDHMCQFLSNEQLFANIRAYPSLISYES